MSRRRQPRTPATSTTPPNDGTPLGALSDADLLREVARRRLTKGTFDIDAIEELATAAQRDLGEETLAAALAALPPEDDKPKACPKCRQLVPVKAKNRLRRILTTAGELRLARNYHYCSCCGRGFAPRDAELNLPEEGEVSTAMGRRHALRDRLPPGRERSPSDLEPVKVWRASRVQHACSDHA